MTHEPAVFIAEFTISRSLGKDERGYEQTEYVARFKVEAMPLTAMTVYQDALSRLMAPIGSISVKDKP